MNKFVTQCVLEADAKALATCVEDKANVVPLSLVKIVDGNIWLIDLFMDKTIQNIKRNPQASFVCWKDSIGYQLKGAVAYVQEGQLYDQACKWVATVNPNRKVKGLLIFSPKEIFDIAPAKNTEEQMEILLRKTDER